MRLRKASGGVTQFAAASKDGDVAVVDLRASASSGGVLRISGAHGGESKNRNRARVVTRVVTRSHA